MLTPAQLQTLKTAIDADPVLAAQPMTMGGAYYIAGELNTAANPAFWVYRTNVPNDEVGNAFNGGEIAGMSSLNMQRLQLLFAASNGTQNGSRADRRDAFDGSFPTSGGAPTRTALAVVWRRQALRSEQIFASGAGSTAAPATMGYEGTLSPDDIVSAREA